MILHGEGAANARRGVEHHVHPLDLPHARQFGQVHARRAAEGGTERAQVAESHAASLSETVDDLDLECVDHGLHVGRSQGALLLDALDDVHVVVGHGGDELGIVEEFAGFEVKQVSCRCAPSVLASAARRCGSAHAEKRKS